MPFYEKGKVRIHYREDGSGFPLFIIPGGGQNSTIEFMTDRAPFNAISEFKDEFRCITADLRNAPSGQSSGPLEIDRPWDSYADDHLGLMDHLGIRRFMVIGYCIGGPFIWKLIERAPERVVAAVVSQPVGFRRDSNPMYANSMETWGPALIKQRPDVVRKFTASKVSLPVSPSESFAFCSYMPSKPPLRSVVYNPALMVKSERLVIATDGDRP